LRAFNSAKILALKAENIVVFRKVHLFYKVLIFIGSMDNAKVTYLPGYKIRRLIENL